MKAYPIHTIREISCGNCGLVVVDGSDCELLRVSGAVHLSVKAERHLAVEFLRALEATPHEGRGEDGRKKQRLRCAECRHDMGIVMQLSDEKTFDASHAPRVLLKCKDVRTSPESYESWKALPESKAAAGDANAAAVVARAAAVAIRNRVKPPPTGPVARRPFPEDAYGLEELNAAMAKQSIADTDVHVEPKDAAARDPEGTLPSWRSRLLSCFGFF